MSLITDKKVRAVIILVLMAVSLYFASVVFGRMFEEEVLVEGPGVTEVKKLSAYFPRLEGTPVDTDVYFLEGDEPGGTALLLGGVHAEEPSGIVTAALVVEMAEVDVGRLIVIPRSNMSALTHNDPQEAFPQGFDLELDDGSIRRFRFASRHTNPIHQWPDPEVFTHYPSGVFLSGQETRNLNRVFPGRANGTLTEQLAYAITTLIEEEDIHITLDLHEASPEYPVNNTIVAHERAIGLASMMRMILEGKGVIISTEISPGSLRGLTHRELGEATETLSMLAETANPIMGRFRGRTTEEKIVTGQEDNYVLGAELGLLFVPFDESGHPLDERVARHLATVESMAEASIEHPMSIRGLPSYEDLCQNGLGYYLQPVD